MQKFITILSLIVVIGVAFADDEQQPVTVETLDSVFLSELKFNLRKETPTNRCQKYLDGIKEALADQSSQANLLIKVSESLKDRRSNSLAQFTDKCYNILTGANVPDYEPKPQEQQPAELPKPQPIIISMPQPEVPQSVPVTIVHNNDNRITKQLQDTVDELQATKERLREAVEEISHLKDSLDRLNIKLMYANRDRVSAEKSADLLKVKLAMGCRSC